MTIPGASGADAASESRSARIPPWPAQGWIAVAGVILLFTGHWFYGALVSDTALVMNIVAALLVGGAMFSGPIRADLLRLRSLDAPALLFAAVILVALWSLTPWAPGGPHPVWAYAGAGPGASTIDKSSTVMETIKLLGLACVFVLGLAAGARDDRARLAVKLTLLVGAAFGVWAIIDAVQRGDAAQGRLLQAHFLDPNTAGLFFAVLLLLGVGDLMRETRGRSLWSPRPATTLAYSQVGIFAICLAYTLSRGAFAAFAVGFLTYLSVAARAGRVKVSRAIWISAGAVVVAAVAAATLGESLAQRVLQFGGAQAVRSEIWRQHWQAFLESPLLGYGLGSTETVNKTLITAHNYPALWNIRAILNVYLQWLEQAGILGAAAMFASIGLILFTTLRRTLGRSRSTLLLSSLLGADAAVLVHGGAEFGLEVFSVAAMWAWLLGLGFSLAQGSSRR